MSDSRVPRGAWLVVGRGPRRTALGFTMIEIMIVLGIIAIMAAVGIPAFYRAFRKEALRQAVSDIVEVLSNARARAILGDAPMMVVFRPQERTVGIRGAPAGEPANPAGLPSGESDLREPRIPRPGALASAQWSDRLVLEMLDVNFIEHKDDDEAHVRFFPNGTSDEMTVILRSENNEYRKISLEVTTGLANVETNPQNFGR